MPEGDTVYRTADVMRRVLGHDQIVAARGRAGGAQLGRLVGSRVRAVRTRGKHLLIDSDGGLTLHTHLGMTGSWHRYRPGERWREDPASAVAVIETVRSVVVCFAAPTVELIETRALPLHPQLAALGPDLLDEEPDIEETLGRLRDAGPAGTAIAEALLDQRIVAGLGNVYRSEVLALARVSPFAPVRSLDDETLRRLLLAASRMLRANLAGEERATVPGARRGERWVYRRAGRPCRRCGSIVRSTPRGRPPRRLYWCPTCQTGRPGPERARGSRTDRAPSAPQDEQHDH